LNFIFTPKYPTLTYGLPRKQSLRRQAAAGGSNHRTREDSPMIKNVAFVILISGFAACTGGKVMPSEGAIGSAQANLDTRVEQVESTNRHMDKVDERVPSEAPAEANSSEIPAEESVTPPTPVTGAYLDCARIPNASLPSNEALVSCRILSEGEKKDLAADVKVDWGYSGGQSLAFTIAYLQPDAAYHVSYRIKASTEQELNAQLPAVRITALIDGQSLETNAVAAEICGAAADLCYNDEAAMGAGLANTPSGKSIEYVISSGSYYVWKEVGGSRILKADGSDSWAQKLNTNGKGFSGADFTAYGDIAGRVCPNNVYIDDNNKFTSGNCLYYTAEANQALNANGSNSILGLADHGSAAKWYYGNISVCSAKGMRLPTLFETNRTDATTWAQYYPTADGNPTFALGNGVPAMAVTTWTATTSTYQSSYYWIWGPQVTGNAYSDIRGIRCVLP
jgi:hypothetical protein